MNFLALRMLFGDRARYIGLVIGITFASLLITQQAAIFLGLTIRTFSFVSDTPEPDIWVMDPEVEHVADSKPMLQTNLYRIRGIDDVAWAVPMFRGFASLRLPNGSLRSCIITGVDDATLVGAPTKMVQGSLHSLREPGGIIVDNAEVGDKLAWTPSNGIKRPLALGDELELNDRRAVVVGTYSISKSFFWEPTVYTTYSRALQMVPQQRRTLSFVLVKAKPGVNPEELARRIEENTGLSARTPGRFMSLTAAYILAKTGIFINFGMAVGLGFLVGLLVTGQTFYNFTIDNLKHFAALKAMGTSSATIVKMVLVQAFVVGALGYGLGVGGASVAGGFLDRSGLAFHLPWQLLVFSGTLIAIVCAVAAVLSVRKVIQLDAASVFKG